MNPPIQYVHKSHTANIKKCGKQHELKSIYNLPESFVNESSLAGGAFHKFAEEIYKSDRPNKWDDWQYWINYFITEFQKVKEEALAKDQVVNTVEDIKAEEFGEMIVEFLKQPWNRNAEPVLIEAKFRFSITTGKGRGKKVYWFEGTLDQLLRVYWKDVPEHFKRQLVALYSKEELEKLERKPYIYIHRDIKSGTRRAMSEIALTCDDNIMFYSYALAHGLFDLKGTGEYMQRIKLIPFAHALYYTRDHLKYKRKTGDNQVGDFKGQGMYFIRKTLEDLKRMEPELIRLHDRVNYGPFTRDGAANSLCDKYCGLKAMCLHDWSNS